jgi:CDP-diacylglycerol--glycerol-3-phosphate 3-phosphatidyltransferase
MADAPSKPQTDPAAPSVPEGMAPAAAPEASPDPGSEPGRRRKKRVKKPKLSVEEWARRRKSLKAEFLNAPNLITVARCVLIPVFTCFALQGDMMGGVIAAHIFGLASAMDALDGWLARKMNLVTTVGKFLDPLADKLMVMSALVSLVWLGRAPAWAVILLLAREFIVTGLRTIAVGEGLVISASQGGKWKTGLQLTGMVCLIIHYTVPVWFGPFGVQIVDFHQDGTVLLYVSLVPSMTSMLGYFKGFLDEIAKREGPAPTNAVPPPA